MDKGQERPQRRGLHDSKLWVGHCFVVMWSAVSDLIPGTVSQPNLIKLNWVELRLSCIELGMIFNKKKIYIFLWGGGRFGGVTKFVGILFNCGAIQEVPVFHKILNLHP